MPDNPQGAFGSGTITVLGAPPQPAATTPTPAPAAPPPSPAATTFRDRILQAVAAAIAGLADQVAAVLAAGEVPFLTHAV